MAGGLQSCQICGDFTLQIDGWSDLIPNYTLLHAEWQEDETFFDGMLHFSCLSGWEHRDAFLTEFRQIETGYGRVLSFEIEGTIHQVKQPGFHYNQQIHQGRDCDIFRHTSTDTWLVLTHQGPWYRLGAAQLDALANGRAARFPGGGHRTKLPPGISNAEVARMDLPELLERLGTTEHYPGLQDGSPEYEVWNYDDTHRILEYSVAVDLPLPEEAVEFLADYARTYEPIVYED
ncbi:hypothetical protein [Streptomyces sedi]|uniref:Uncharacterized protein n=1 Tax=Streptomyces sedi TaxID=555059 RepID=A0A5C4V3Y4_9ACTN|nr:hypothetical protein [Streptomyces sedi]TNM29779.1 hypothetical protein FH715_13605 [Streptomyces sedi]